MFRFIDQLLVLFGPLLNLFELHRSLVVKAIFGKHIQPCSEQSYTFLIAEKISKRNTEVLGFFTVDLGNLRALVEVPINGSFYLALESVRNQLVLRDAFDALCLQDPLLQVISLDRLGKHVAIQGIDNLKFVRNKRIEFLKVIVVSLRLLVLFAAFLILRLNCGPLLIQMM